MICCENVVKMLSTLHLSKIKYKYLERCYSTIIKIGWYCSTIVNSFGFKRPSNGGFFETRKLNMPTYGICKSGCECCMGVRCVIAYLWIGLHVNMLSKKSIT